MYCELLVLFCELEAQVDLSVKHIGMGRTYVGHVAGVRRVRVRSQRVGGDVAGNIL
jgi:hypothetical protein